MHGAVNKESCFFIAPCFLIVKHSIHGKKNMPPAVASLCELSWLATDSSSKSVLLFTQQTAHSHDRPVTGVYLSQYTSNLRLDLLQRWMNTSYKPSIQNIACSDLSLPSPQCVGKHSKFVCVLYGRSRVMAVQDVSQAIRIWLLRSFAGIDWLTSISTPWKNSRLS